MYDSGFSVGTSEGVKPSLFLDNRIYSQDTILVKSANPIFAHWCFLPLFATIYSKGGKAIKKIIILLLALLMSACSAVKPAETLSSMQTEPKRLLQIRR